MTLPGIEKTILCISISYQPCIHRQLLGTIDAHGICRLFGNAK